MLSLPLKKTLPDPGQLVVGDGSALALFVGALRIRGVPSEYSLISLECQKPPHIHLDV